MARKITSFLINKLFYNNKITLYDRNTYYSYNALFNLLILLGFSYHYIGYIGLLSYLLAFFGIKYVFKLNEILILIFLFSYFILSLIVSDVITVITSFRYHFGFIIFYLYFRNFNSNINFRPFFIFLLLITIVEMILINTFIDPRLMPNYPEYDYVNNFSTHFNFDWQRVYGFAANSSILSTHLIVLFSIINLQVLILPLFFVILLIGSGTGLVSLTIYFLFFLKKNIIKFLFIILPLLLIISILFYDNNKFLIFNKIFSINFYTLVDTKILFLSNFFNTDITNIFFGNINENIGGDFAWASMLTSHGFISLIIIFFFMGSKCNKDNFFPIMLLILTSFHYYTIFSLPGQILTGYVLAYKKQHTN